MTNIRISRSTHSDMIYVNERGSTRCYSLAMWDEFSRMVRDFNTLGVPSIQNYTDLPARTPIHSNIPKKDSIDDLI